MKPAAAHTHAILSEIENRPSFFCGLLWYPFLYSDLVGSSQVPLLIVGRNA